MKEILALVLSLAALCRTAPGDLGLHFDKRAGSLPTLKLPYATYQAASYDPNGDVCLLIPVDVPTADLSCRSIPSRTFVSPPRQLGMYDGLSRLLQRQKQRSKMALTAPFAFKPLSRDLS